jgi:hypothetical protein
MSERRIDIFREIVIVLVLSLVLVSTLGIKTVNAQAGQVTLHLSDDTYVDSSNANANYGGQDYLEIQNYQEAILGQTYNYECVVWLKFDLSSVPYRAEVDGAALQLVSHDYLETFNVHAYSCPNNSWTEYTLTYLNMPSYNTTSMDSVSTMLYGYWYNWSVVDAVRNALNSNSKAVTIVLRDPSLHNSSVYVDFISKEYDYQSVPKLAIHWRGVVPEFPIFLVLPLFMIAIAVTFYEQSRHRKGSS